MQATQRYWAVVPAAGSGVRMGGERPKQYLPLGGRTVIEHTLQRLLDHEKISGIVIAIAANDNCFTAVRSRLVDHGKLCLVVEGGAERFQSVLNALHALEKIASATDWVLVHDAVRPCIRRDDIDRLIDALQGHAVGGLLGLPLHDTVKRVEAAHVAATLDRNLLWRALTPQMFRLDALREALGRVQIDQLAATDECAAMEYAGVAPQMVEGASDNIKITLPQDLMLAEFYLRQQENEE